MNMLCKIGIHSWCKVKMLSKYQVADKVCERCGMRKVFHGWGWTFKKN